MDRALTVRAAHEFWWDSHPDLYRSWHRGVDTEAVASLDLEDRLLASSRGLFQGVTTNPILIREAIDADDKAQTRSLIQGISTRAELWTKYHSSVERASKYGLSAWERSGGRFGWVCAQVDPDLCHDTMGMVRHGLKLASLAPNIMIKIPASRAGFGAVRALASAGKSINVTAGFSVAQASAFASALQLGLAVRRADSVDPGPCRYVYTLMLGRIGRDQELLDMAGANGASKVRHLEVDVAWAVHRFLERANAPIELLFSSVKLDSGTSHSALHLTHTPPNAIFTLNPSVAKTILIQKLLMEPKRESGAGSILNGWYLDSTAASRLFQQNVVDTEFERWPQFREAISNALVATRSG